MVTSSLPIEGSFRDPSGTVFVKDNEIYRSVSCNYQENYDFLMQSGLYKRLIEEGLLIPHQEIDSSNTKCFKIIKPVQIPFISQPYEWCFSELKDAALTTLKIQKIALDYGMCLKDASAYNIQFFKGKPLLIDTLSFEKYESGQPWVAYRQFCMHFLAPLLLVVYKSPELNRLLQLYIDGIPLSLATSLLPIRALLRPAVFIHIYLHSKAELRFGNKKTRLSKPMMKKIGLVGLIENLNQLVLGLNIKDQRSFWSNYYFDNNYSSSAMRSKIKIVSGIIQKIKPKVVWDLGANTGLFSQLASKFSKSVISMDFEPLVAEANYIHCQKDNLSNCLPLVVNLFNPSPSIGWDNQERLSLLKRGPADLIMALALIHHLAIGNNLPFDKIAGFLKKLCDYLIMEFIPKDDSQVQLLLQNRRDIFYDYNKDSFEASFSKYFTILEKHDIKGSKRYVYFMKSK